MFLIKLLNINDLWFFIALIWGRTKGNANYISMPLLSLSLPATVEVTPNSKQPQQWQLYLGILPEGEEEGDWFICFVSLSSCHFFSSAWNIWDCWTAMKSWGKSKGETITKKGRVDRRKYVSLIKLLLDSKHWLHFFLTWKKK